MSENIELEKRVERLETLIENLNASWLEHFADVRRALEQSEKALIIAADALANVRTVIRLNSEFPRGPQAGEE